MATKRTRKPARPRESSWRLRRTLGQKVKPSAKRYRRKARAPARQGEPSDGES